MLLLTYGIVISSVFVIKIDYHKNVFCSPFPTVAEAVQEELEDYKSKEDEVRRLKRAMVNDFYCLHRYWNC